MPCPFFLPISRFDDAAWLHPSRLPLGAGWNGECCAPGHEGTIPASDELRESCNIGYAENCARLPEQRHADAVRFSVARDRGTHLELWFIFERDHRPAGHGKLEYDVIAAEWISPHPVARIQKMAECYVQSYLPRRKAMEFSSKTA